MKIIAHRGASGYAPENTIAAFKKALEQKPYMIEFDVYALQSGEVIIMHDNRVDRTTDGKGYVHELTFQDLRLLNAGDTEQIPTLQEALDCIDRQVRANIELKGPGTARAVAEIIRQYMRRGWQEDDFLVSSFNHPELALFKQLMPEVDISALQDSVPVDYAAFAQDLGAVAASPGREFVNDAYVADAHKRGLLVFVWTVNEPEEVARMLHMNVDGIFTNYPDIAYKTIAAQ